MDTFYIKFDPSVPLATERRILYVFKVFLAIYGHSLTTSEDQASIKLIYGPCTHDGNPRPLDGWFHLPATYKFRPASEAVKSPTATIEIDGHTVPLFHSPYDAIDQLGEAFEWISLAHEHSVLERDKVGRIEETHNIFNTFNISPLVPYASLLLAELAQKIKVWCVDQGITFPSPEKARCFIIPSHDVDFHYNGPATAILRFVKNIVIAALLLRSRSFFKSNLLYLIKSLCGVRVGNYTGRLAARERENGFSSDFYFLTGGTHRRDSNYTLDDALPWVTEVHRHGGNVGLHGSYRSVIEEQHLDIEMRALRHAYPFGLGNRQHWLRFDTHEKLYRCIEQSGCEFDSTLGFSSMPGFRCGVDFAFPPYDFANERPCDFLEIPLVIMDSTLTSLSFNEQQRVARAITEAKFGQHTSCISILWHNPIEATAVPAETNQIYWDLAPKAVNASSKKNSTGPEWTSGANFINQMRERYIAAGFTLRT